jgi:hypothetical protein
LTIIEKIESLCELRVHEGHTRLVDHEVLRLDELGPILIEVEVAGREVLLLGGEK